MVYHGRTAENLGVRRVIEPVTAGWYDAGEVEAAWVRPDRGEPPALAREVEAVTGTGLRGDCHADALSPRQVLLASAHTYRRLSLPPAALRENVTVSNAIALVRPGSLVALGERVLVWVTFRCEPCAKLNRQRPGLVRVVGPERGVLARVVRGGRVRAGDAIRVLPGVLPAWPDAWQERVRHVAAAVPESAVVDYRHLARLAGVPLAYCRVFPRVLAAAPGGSWRRAVPSGALPGVARWGGEALFLSACDAVRLHAPVARTASRT